jgi:acyl carrier protein
MKIDREDFKKRLIKDLNLEEIIRDEPLQDDEILFGDGSRFYLDSLDFLSAVTIVKEQYNVEIYLINLGMKKMMEIMKTINTMVDYIESQS